MTDKQPEALRLADLIDNQGPALRVAVSAELRRLHELNTEFVEALRRIKLEKGFVCDCGIEDATWDLIEAVQEKADDSH